jgi:signal peptidase I
MGVSFVRKNVFKLASALALMLVATFLCTYIFKVFTPHSPEYVVFWVATLAVIVALVGFTKNKSATASSVMQIIIIYVLLYFLVIYLSGFLVGFVNNGYGLAPLTILGNLWPVLALIILQELARHAIVKKCGDNKILLWSTAVVFIIIDIAVGLQLYNLAQPLELFEMIGILGLAGVARNALLTFVAYKSSYKPTLLYRLMTEPYVYLVPFLPDLGPYIGSVMSILLPTLLVIRFNEFFVTKHSLPGRERRVWRILTLVPVTSILIMMVVLVSGIFRYYAMAIGSASMEPTIGVGDVVIIDKDARDLEQIEPGTVIAFQHDNQVIVHRLLEVKQQESQLVALTKGDNNDDSDGWDITNQDLVGVVNLRVPWLGWPTVWLDRTLINNNEGESHY